MSEVRLVDLDVIKRYSLAVRQEWAPAEEVLAALEASRRQVLAATGPEGRGRRRRPRPPDRPTS
ncbi:MAG TPA: hypothetical protein VMZ51_05470 [Acidimicrobiales bacterium]|nr:hypothetical protein [Acidimicrobiales bacterium]